MSVKLTPSQEAKAQEFCEHWYRKGMMTSLADRPAVEKSLDSLLDRNGLDMKPVLWVKGPGTARALLSIISMYCCEKPNSLLDRIDALTGLSPRKAAK